MSDRTPLAAKPAPGAAPPRSASRLPRDDDRTRALREKATQTARLNLLDRERSLIQFNRRVLAQARRADVPLLERLRYVTIVSSNLDEFFEVRVADYIEAVRQPGSGITQADLDAVARAAHELIDEQYQVFNDEVMPALEAEGIVVLNHAHW
jgi:polyphosphate kinase